MYDPAVQRAVLEKLARWRHLPEGDLIGMLSPVERLRYRPEALDDLEWDGLIVARVAGDERMVSITEAGEAGTRGCARFEPPGSLRASPNRLGANGPASVLVSLEPRGLATTRRWPTPCLQAWPTGSGPRTRRWRSPCC